MRYMEVMLCNAFSLSVVFCSVADTVGEVVESVFFVGFTTAEQGFEKYLCIFGEMGTFSLKTKLRFMGVVVCQ
jgi:hypothetical protein